MKKRQVISKLMAMVMSASLFFTPMAASIPVLAETTPEEAEGMQDLVEIEESVDSKVDVDSSESIENGAALGAWENMKNLTYEVENEGDLEHDELNSQDATGTDTATSDVANNEQKEEQTGNDAVENQAAPVTVTDGEEIEDPKTVANGEETETPVTVTNGEEIEAAEDEAWESEVVPDAMADAADETVNTYKIGDNVTAVLYEDGSLVISGTGSTYDYHGTGGTYNFSGMHYTPFYTDSVYQKIQTITVSEGVTGIGTLLFEGSSKLTKVTLPSSLVSIGDGVFKNCSLLNDINFPEGLTSIGANAFSGCSSLTAITMPESLTSLGDSVFYGCTSLNSASIKSNVKELPANAFYNCSSLRTVTLPETLTCIGSSAFNGCTSLRKITIPDSVRTIKSSAFYGCTALYNIKMPSCLEAIESETFRNCQALASMSIPDNVIEIGGNAFDGCKSLRTLSIPGKVTRLGNAVFTGCTGLRTVEMADSVINIGNNVFEGCTALTGITLSSNLGTIGNYDFNGCTSLRSITIPDSVSSIGKSAFQGCTRLKTVEIPFSVSTIGKDAFINCTALTDVTIDGGVASIGEGAFHNCTALKNLKIEDGVTEIGHSAFMGCSRLTEVTIPGSVTTIDASFENCTALKTVYLEDGIVTIEGSAFNGCSALTEITIPESVTTISGSAFNGCSSLMNVSVSDGVSKIGYNSFAEIGDGASVYFAGDAPTMDSYMFNRAKNLQVYYPADNDTWEGKTGDYGGSNITWIGYQTGSEPILLWSKPLGYYAEIRGDINFNFVLEVSAGAQAAPESTYVQFTLADGSTQKMTVADAQGTYVDGVKGYVFTCEVPAKNIADTITAQLMDDYGNHGIVHSMSVKEYCEKIIANKADYSDELVAFVQAMLNYGATAQNYFNYNTGNLASSDLSDFADVTLSSIAPYHEFALDEENKDLISYSGVSLNLDAKTSMRIYFTAADGYNVSAIDLKKNEALDIGSNNGIFFVDIQDIYPRDLDDIQRIRLTATKSDNTDITYNSLIAVSPMDYCYKVFNNENASATLRQLMKALFRYFETAEQCDAYMRQE